MTSDDETELVKALRAELAIEKKRRLLAERYAIQNAMQANQLALADVERELAKIGWSPPKGD